MKIIKKQIILASASRWRRRLLKKHGINCRVRVSDFEEIKKHISPRLLAIHNACGKAEAVARHYGWRCDDKRCNKMPGKNAGIKNLIVIGVDTIGVLRGKILGKPCDRAHAKAMIQALSGTTHSVISGLCVIDVANRKRIKTVVVTKVTFRKVSEKELEKYLDSNHWKGKAGAYAIQGRAKGFIAKIEGDFTNVVGLPVECLRKILKKIPK